jgi:hypothetical protein
MTGSLLVSFLQRIVPLSQDTASLYHRLIIEKKANLPQQMGWGIDENTSHNREYPLIRQSQVL